MTTNRAPKKPRLLKTSEVFKLLRARISLKLDRFICCAISLEVNLNATDSERVEDIIYSRMQTGKFATNGGHNFCTLENWLLVNHNINVFLLFQSYPERHEQMRLYRIRWLDTLVQEFETKGD